MEALDNLSLAARIEELEKRVEFVLQSTQITMNIPSGLLAANGQPQMTQISGPLLSFYLKARQHGKSQLGQLTPDDFGTEISAARVQSLATGPAGSGGGAPAGAAH